MTKSPIHRAPADAPETPDEAAVKASVREQFNEEVRHIGQPVCALPGNDYWMVSVQYTDGKYAILLGNPDYNNWTELPLNDTVVRYIGSATAMPQITVDAAGIGKVMLPMGKTKYYFLL